MNDDDFVTHNLATDIYHFDLDSAQILTFVNKQIAEYNSKEENETEFTTGIITLSEPVIKKIEKAFNSFRKKNEIPFMIEYSPIIMVENFDKNSNVTDLCHAHVNCSCILMMVLEDHTHSAISFYPRANTNKSLLKPKYEYFCGEGQSHLLNNKIIHEHKTDSRGTRITLSLGLSTGFHRIKRYL